MKAYVYRSGHVMIGPSIPEGAVEIADWDNEAELLTILRWQVHCVEDSEGCPAMVILEVMKGNGNERAVISTVKFFRERIQHALKIVREHPHGNALVTIGAIERWSPESVEAFR